MVLLGYPYFKPCNYVRNCPLQLCSFNKQPNCGYNLKYSSKVFTLKLFSIRTFKYFLNCLKKQFRDIYSKINKLCSSGNVFNVTAGPFSHCHIRQPLHHHLRIIVRNLNFFFCFKRKAGCDFQHHFLNTCPTQPKPESPQVVPSLSAAAG